VKLTATTIVSDWHDGSPTGSLSSATPISTPLASGITPSEYIQARELVGGEFLTTKFLHQATPTRNPSLSCHSSLQVALPAAKMAAGEFGDERTEMGMCRPSVFSPGASQSNTSKRLLEQTVSPTQGALSGTSLDSIAPAIVLRAIHMRCTSHHQLRQQPRSPQLGSTDPRSYQPPLSLSNIGTQHSFSLGFFVPLDIGARTTGSPTEPAGGGFGGFGLNLHRRTVVPD
jgi:hypothetical protein